MEIEKPCPFDAFTRYLKGPVTASPLSSCFTLCAPSHIQVLPCSLPFAEVFLLACQVPLNPLSLIFCLPHRCVYDISSCEVTARIPIPPRSVCSFILVQSSSWSGLSVSFSHVSLVFASCVSAKGLSFLGLRTFASKPRALAIAFDVINQRASVFLVSRCSCVIASTWPSEFSRLPQTRSGQGGVVFVSSRRVPLSCFSSQYCNLLLERAFCGPTPSSLVLYSTIWIDQTRGQSLFGPHLCRPTACPLPRRPRSPRSRQHVR